MAQKITVRLVDDIDGTSEAAETVSLGLDGVDYELDLTEQHAQELRSSLGRYLEVGRRVGGRKRYAAGSTPAVRHPKWAIDAVRSWANTPEGQQVLNDNNAQIAERGRISIKVWRIWAKNGASQTDMVKARSGPDADPSFAEYDPGRN